MASWEFLDLELVKAFCQHRLVLMVGAGISKNVHYKSTTTVGMNHKPQQTLPNWPELLRDMLEWVGSNPTLGIPPNKQEIEDLIDEKKFLIAGQELLDFIRTHAHNELKIFLDQLFNENQFNISLLSVSEVHDLLPKINFLRGIVTTNYDKLIETAYDYQQQQNINVIQKDDIGKVPLPLRSDDEFFIFKMHGQYDREIVLGTRDYQDVMFNTPGYREFIQTLFTVSTILFVGYSNDDPNVNSILDRAAAIYNRQSDTHFLLMKKDEIKNQTERMRLEKDKRVRVIEFVDYPDVLEIFNVLEGIQKWCGQLKPILKLPHPQGMKIFVSSRFIDQDIANQVSASLQEHGHNVWRGDPNTDFMPHLTDSEGNILPEPEWFHVSWAVGEADCIIVLFTQNTMESHYVLNEAHYGLYWSNKRAIALLPLVVDQMQPPLYLQNDFQTRIDSQFSRASEERLLETLNKIQVWLEMRRREISVDRDSGNESNTFALDET